MIKTVIVDDDFLVRSYLKQLKAWKTEGYEIVADARDGEEALKVIEEFRPELLVTDISMPLVNGIELIRKVREISNSVYIIVLSCHDDFEYVKEAMKLGADEYVLKNTLNEESLCEILENTNRQLESRFRKEDEVNRLMEMGRNSLKYHFFNKLLAGGFSSEEREKKRKEAGIHSRFMNSAVVNMFIPKWAFLKSQYTALELEQYGQRFLRKLAEELKDSEDAGDCTECVYLGEGVFCCFIDMSELRRSSLMKQRLAGVAASCVRCCKAEDYTFEIAVSNICFGEEGIRQAYQQARETGKNAFYEEADILYYEDGLKIGDALPGEADYLLEKANGYVEKKQYENLERDFRMVIESTKRQRTDPRLIRQWIKTLDQRLGIEKSQEEYGKIVKIEQLMDFCEEYQRKLFFGKEKSVPEGTSHSIKTVINYLHEHYKEQIGLTEAAVAVGLNSAYLSYLFKQEVGIGFSAYLLELRMECAKALLRNTNDKVKEVARQSGFNDYHYFSKAFKKINEISPLEYRKQNSEI